MRNHNVLKRDMIIQKVASLVGPGHKVDLKNYDKLIVVEAYKVTITSSLECQTSRANAMTERLWYECRTRRL